MRRLRRLACRLASAEFLPNRQKITDLIGPQQRNILSPLIYRLASDTQGLGKLASRPVKYLKRV